MKNCPSVRKLFIWPLALGCEDLHLCEQSFLQDPLSKKITLSSLLVMIIIIKGITMTNHLQINVGTKYIRIFQKVKKISHLFLISASSTCLYITSYLSVTLFQWTVSSLIHGGGVNRFSHMQTLEGGTLWAWAGINLFDCKLK